MLKISNFFRFCYSIIYHNCYYSLLFENTYIITCISKLFVLSFEWEYLSKRFGLKSN